MQEQIKASSILQLSFSPLTLILLGFICLVCIPGKGLTFNTRVVTQSALLSLQHYYLINLHSQQHIRKLLGNEDGVFTGTSS